MRIAKIIYDNTLILDPEGQPLCRSTRKKAEYYLTKKLAVRIGDGEPLVIKLLFSPAGPGSIGDPYLLRALKNRCVVCGREENLTRHHVVPDRYRKWFPADTGYLTHFDLLALCVKCHKVYEAKARDFNNRLEKEFGVPEWTRRRPCDRQILAVLSHAGALLYHLEKLPPTRISECLHTLRAYNGRPNITRQDLIEALLLDPHDGQGEYVSPARYMVGKLTTPAEFNHFARHWRRHFIETMKPRFLELDWNLERPASGKDGGDRQLKNKQRRRKPITEEERCAWHNERRKERVRATCSW